MSDRELARLPRSAAGLPPAERRLCRSRARPRWAHRAPALHVVHERAPARALRQRARLRAVAVGGAGDLPAGGAASRATPAHASTQHQRDRRRRRARSRPRARLTHMQRLLERQAAPGAAGGVRAAVRAARRHYGLWDPWETHYGEVARQMVERDDLISLWWPGSPHDRAEVFSQAGAHFWLMALSLKLFGLECAGGVSVGDGRLVARRSGRCAAAQSSCCRWRRSCRAVALVRRLAGRARRRWSARSVLATSSQWVLVTRQAMTDMPFVAPMTVALALRRRWRCSRPTRRELPRRRCARRSSWPHALAFYGFVALLLLTSAAAAAWWTRSSCACASARAACGCPASSPMLPYRGCFCVGLWWCARARTRAPALSAVAWVAVRAGDAGQGTGGAGACRRWCSSLYLVLRRARARDLAGSSCRAARSSSSPAAFPWYHAMLIRHGAAVLERAHRRQLRPPRRPAATAIAAPSSTTCRGSATACSPGRASSPSGASCRGCAARSRARALAALRAGLGRSSTLDHRDAGEHQVPPLRRCRRCRRWRSSPALSSTTVSTRRRAGSARAGARRRCR